MDTQLNHLKSRKVYCLILFTFVFLLISGCKSSNPVPQNNTLVSQNENAIAAINLGKNYYEQKNYDKAIEEFTKAIRLDPNNANAYISRSSVFVAKGEYRLGMKDLDYAIPLTRDPKIMEKINSVYLSIPEDKSKVTNPYNLSLKSIQRKDALVAVEFCFNLPSDTNWTIETRDGFGEVAGYQAKLITNKDTFDVVAWNDPQESMTLKKGDLKCESIEFQPPDSVNLSNSKIIINKLVVPIPEKPNCKKVQEKINQLHPGFVVGCDTSGSGSSIGLISGPSNISLGQAYTFLDDALHDAVVYGPWIFSTGLRK